MRQKAHGIWACVIILSRPVSLTARMENKNRRGGHCDEMQGRAKSLSLPEWTRTLLSPAIRRSPMSAAVLKCDAPESDPATLECCLFCVASYHCSREALCVTVDGRTISAGKPGVKSMGGSYFNYTRTRKDADEISGMNRDVIWSELFLLGYAAQMQHHQIHVDQRSCPGPKPPGVRRAPYPIRVRSCSIRSQACRCRSALASRRAGSSPSPSSNLATATGPSLR